MQPGLGPFSQKVILNAQGREGGIRRGGRSREEGGGRRRKDEEEEEKDEIGGGEGLIWSSLGMHAKQL